MVFVRPSIIAPMMDAPDIEGNEASPLLGLKRRPSDGIMG